MVGPVKEGVLGGAPPHSTPLHPGHFPGLGCRKEALRVGLETNQPDGSPDNPAEYSHPGYEAPPPGRGERAALTVSPLSSFSQVSQTQPYRGRALFPTWHCGRSCAQGSALSGRARSASGGACRVAWGGVGEEQAATGKGRARPDPAEPRWN